MNTLDEPKVSQTAPLVPQNSEAIDFTAEELYLIKYYQQRVSASRTWVWYVVYVFPTTLFASYGVVNRDVLAVAVAFGALLLFSLYWLQGGVKHSRQLKSILWKYQKQNQRLQAQLAQILPPGEP